jgi:hypothetical protein
MEIATIKVKCCDQDEAVMQMNKDGLLHFRCVYCGFEISAGSQYHVKWTPHHGVEVRGIRQDQSGEPAKCCD